nr:uncharacterized protein CI109_000181 [Kwoniella shandongensis]KAA5531340.1 hypothetical protein CI109_000181 [Kwoniella shandongensis]
MTEQQDTKEHLALVRRGYYQGSQSGQAMTTNKELTTRHYSSNQTYQNTDPQQISSPRPEVRAYDYGFEQGHPGRPQAFNPQPSRGQQSSELASGTMQTSTGAARNPHYAQATSIDAHQPPIHSTRQGQIDSSGASYQAHRYGNLETHSMPPPQNTAGQNMRSRDNGVSPTPSISTIKKEYIQPQQSIGSVAEANRNGHHVHNDQATSFRPLRTFGPHTATHNISPIDTGRLPQDPRVWAASNGHQVQNQSNGSNPQNTIRLERRVGMFRNPTPDGQAGLAMTGPPLNGPSDLSQMNNLQAYRSTPTELSSPVQGIPPDAIGGLASIANSDFTMTFDDDDDDSDDGTGTNQSTLKTPGKRALDDEGNTSVFNFTPSTKSGVKQVITPKPRFVVPKVLADHTALLINIDREAIFRERLALAKGFKHCGVFQDTARLTQQQNERMKTVSDQFNVLHDALKGLMKKKDAELHRKEQLTDRYAEAGSELSVQCVDLQAATRNSSKNKAKRRRGNE